MFPGNTSGLVPRRESPGLCSKSWAKPICTHTHVGGEAGHKLRRGGGNGTHAASGKEHGSNVPGVAVAGSAAGEAVVAGGSGAEKRGAGGGLGLEAGCTQRSERLEDGSAARANHGGGPAIKGPARRPGELAGNDSGAHSLAAAARRRRPEHAATGDGWTGSPRPTQPRRNPSARHRREQPKHMVSPRSGRTAGQMDPARQ